MFETSVNKSIRKIWKNFGESFGNGEQDRGVGASGYSEGR
jgi:hypothetical protein